MYLWLPAACDVWRHVELIVVHSGEGTSSCRRSRWQEQEGIGTGTDLAATPTAIGCTVRLVTGINQFCFSNRRSKKSNLKSKSVEVEVSTCRRLKSMVILRFLRVLRHNWKRSRCDTLKGIPQVVADTLLFWQRNNFTNELIRVRVVRSGIELFGWFMLERWTAIPWPKKAQSSAANK